MSSNIALSQPYRTAPSMIPLLSLARATLMLSPPGFITFRLLKERACFFFRQFRLRFNRRQRSSIKDKKFHQLCSKFLEYSPGLKIPPSLKTLAGKAMTAATTNPLQADLWKTVQKFLTQRKPRSSRVAWPLQRGGDPVKILFWNCNGQHTEEHKRTLLTQTHLETKVDIIALAETKLRNPLPPTRDFIVSGFTTALSRDETSRHLAGGIVVGKTPSVSLTMRTRHVFTGYIEAIASTVKRHPNPDFIMITAYIPPYSICPLRGRYDDCNFLSQLRSLYGTPLLLVADANCDTATWTGCGTTTIRTLLNEGWVLKSSTHEPTSLHTTQGKCIDILLTRDFPYPCACQVLPLSTTDHQGLLVTVYGSKKKTRRPNTCNRHSAIAFAKALMVSMETDPNHPDRKIAQDLVDNMPTSGECTAHDAPIFAEIIDLVNSFEKSILSRPSKSKDPLYLRLKNALRRHYQAIKSLKHHGSRTCSQRHLVNILSTITACRSLTTRLINDIHSRSSAQDAINAVTTATQDLTTNAIIRRIERACNPRNPVIDFTSLDPAQLDRHRLFWENRWSSAYLLPQDRQESLNRFLDSSQPLNPPHGRVFRAFSITHLSDGTPWLTDDAEIAKAISTISNGRAPGPSGLPVDLFKLIPHFHQALSILFNSIIAEQQTPPQFSPCSLILLHKAGIITEPKNFRPLNLTESGFRIFEAVIRLRMDSWMDFVLHQNQFGFRRGQSTMSALLSVVTEVHSAISQRTPLYACFLDAVKAFDRVPHQAIIEAAMQHGLCPSSCRLLSAIISNHTSAVRDPVSQVLAFQIPVNCGTLQGGINSPPLFSLFLNTLFDTLDPSDPSDTRLYADDRTILTSILSKLQDSVVQLNEWASTRNLLHDGNELIVINAPDPPPILIHDKPLSTVSSTVCLGLTISKDGTVARANVVSKANYTCIKLSSLWSRARSRVPLSMLKALIYRYFIPTTTYGAALCTTDVGISLDKTVYKIIRNAVACHPSTNTTLLLEFTGIIRPTIRIQQQIISVLHRSLVNTSSIIQDSIRAQFTLRLPFATKVLSVLHHLKTFPLCGPRLATQLEEILALPAPDLREPQLTFTPPPYIPPPPTQTHMLAFTDGSKSEHGLCGCATVLLIGVPADGRVVTSSFFLPDVKENNAAELQAILNVIDQAITLKTSHFPDLDSITIVSDSMNSVKSIQGTFLLTDPVFLTLLHQLLRMLSSYKFKIFVKWVKAHDDGKSPFNELADTWADRSIAERHMLTNTMPLTQEDVDKATLPIAWHDSEAPPVDTVGLIRRFNLIAKNAILFQEDARYRQTLTRYIHPHLISFPGTGSKLLNSSQQPNGHFLLTLRRDPETHFADHPTLNKFSEACPWCRDNSKPTNTHLFLECLLSRTSNKDRRRIITSRSHILGPNHQLDSSSLKLYFARLTSQSFAPPEDADLIIKHQARMRFLYMKYRVRKSNTESPLDSPSPDHEISEDDPDLPGREGGLGQQPVASSRYHHGADARQIILSRIEASRTAEELDAVFAHYGKTLDVYNLWSKKHAREFFRPIYLRQWLRRCEDYLTILNCPTFELRYHAYLQYENSDRPYSKSSTRPVTSSSTGLAPRYAGRKSTNMSGFRDKFQEMRAHINSSFLRHSVALPILPTRPNRERTTTKAYRPHHHCLVPSPPWAFHLDWSLQLSAPLVEAWLAAPSSISQRDLIRQAWPAHWSKTSVIQTHMKIDSACYCRQTLINKKGNSLLQLYDLIREALAAGEISTNPPYPELTAAAIAKQATASTHQAAYQSAALILIFTPIEILRQQVTILVNPISFTNSNARANFPDTLRPFAPRESVFHQVSDMLSLSPDLCVVAARGLAQRQMNLGRHHPQNSFPDLPSAIPGSETTYTGSDSSVFDDDVFSNDSDS